MRMVEDTLKQSLVIARISRKGGAPPRWSSQFVGEHLCRSVFWVRRGAVCKALHVFSV